MNINFIKINKKIIHSKKSCYFSISEFLIIGGDKNINNEEEIITEFINSKFFLWKEDFLDNVEVVINGQKTFVDWNFHGLYDVKKIKYGDYQNVDFNLFRKTFIDFIELNVGVISELLDIDNEIKNMQKENSSFYVIKPLSEDKIHRWTVYELFLSGIIIDLSKKNISLVEFGLD